MFRVFGIVLVIFLLVAEYAIGYTLHNITQLSCEKRAINPRLANCYCDDFKKICKFSDAIDLRIANEECPKNRLDGQAKYCDIGFGLNSEVCGYRKLISTTFPEGIANIGEYPWHVAIFIFERKKEIRIGVGVLITSNHVLTVAHKVQSLEQSSIVVRIGDTSNYGDNSCRSYDYKVQYRIIHPTFDGSTKDDIAVLRLLGSVPLANNPHINFACLPREPLKPNKRCWVSGWSEEKYDYFGSFINPLREVDLPIVDSNQCEAQLQTTRLSHSFKLDKKSLICAGGEPGKDSCSGNGGAPLVCERANGQWEVVGLVAAGVSCGQPFPAFYVNIRTYISWIHEQVINSN